LYLEDVIQRDFEVFYMVYRPLEMMRLKHKNYIIPEYVTEKKKQKNKNQYIQEL